MGSDTIMMAMFLGVMLAFVILMVVQYRERQQQKEQMQQQIQKQQEYLSRFEFQINQSLKSDLLYLSEKVKDMELSINERLHQGMLCTNEVMHEVKQQMVHLDDAQIGLTNLSKNIQELQYVLVDKKARGIYGEVELYCVLEQVFGQQGPRYKTQAKLSNGTIVDALLFGNESMGDIPIDSKFPLENYRRMFDQSKSKQEQQLAEKQFKYDVVKHIKDIHDKYIKDVQTSDFAYMFVPAEAIFAYMYANMEDMIRMSYEKKVYIVSATTLMAYLTAMRSIYLGKKRDEAVVMMQKEYAILASEFARYQERMENLSKDFSKVQQDFQQLSITQQKINTHFQKIEAVEFEDTRS